MSRSYSARKQAYRLKLLSLLDEYSTVMLVSVDNVGSGQIQEIRSVLRGEAVMLMGKNTMIRTIMREKAEEKPELNALADAMRGNVGMVFTNGDVNELRSKIEENQVPAAARVGLLSPIDVIIPAGPTGLDPGQTSFFQALQIATKIVRGSINIMNPVNLVAAGERVGASAVSLLNKLNLKPFFFSMLVTKVYENGTLYGSEILDMTDDILLGKFFNGVQKLASLSLAAGFANMATLSHSLARAFKNVLALAVVSDFTFKEAEKFEEYLADPAAYAAKHGLATGPAAGAAAPAAEVAAPEPEEESEEEDVDFDLFG